MKGKIIETAGKTWKILGEKKEVKVTDLAKLVKEKGEVVFQSLGWLAREDKITYVSRKNQTFVSLIEPELECFRSFFPLKTTLTKKTKAVKIDKKVKAAKIIKAVKAVRATKVSIKKAVKSRLKKVLKIKK